MFDKFNLKQTWCIAALLILLTTPGLASTQPNETDSAEPAQAPADPAATGGDEEEPLAQRYDPKHQQYLRGKLAYWFKNYDLAYKEWRPLADEGIAHAEASVGWLYHNGLGVEKNLNSAFDWYQKSAEQGYAIGQHNLGIMYENGWGTEQNLKKARELYTLAAEQAYGLSLFNLALFYKNGLGGEEDQDKAIHLLRQAYILNVDEAWDVLAEMGVEIPKREIASHQLPADDAQQGETQPRIWHKEE